MIYYKKDGSLASIKKQDREWVLFCIFGLEELKPNAEGWCHHCEWVRRRPFETPDEWLGSEGNRYRQRYNWHNPSHEFCQKWENFKQANAKTSLREIQDMAYIVFEDADDREEMNDD
jgi:hypothetical protein